MNVAMKHFWLIGTWTQQAPLQWKPLRDVTVGWKEFKPPEWQNFTS